MKNSRATLFFRESASCSRILNNKKYTFNTVNLVHPLFFSASCSKILNVKTICNAVKYSRATLFSGQVYVTQNSRIIKIYSIQWKISGHPLFFRASASCSKILNGKKYIQYSENFQGKLCFQGKRKLLKILNVKSIFNTVKNFRATLFFQGKRKLLKNRERWKDFQYSVYSPGGDPSNSG